MSRSNEYSSDREARALDERLLAWMERAPAGFVRFESTRAACYGLDASTAGQLTREFEDLALDVFAYQFDRIEVYRAFALLLDRSPSRLRSSYEIPALPLEAFRGERVACSPSERDVAVFHTSGTSRELTGALFLDTLRLYDASLERAFKHHVLPDCAQMCMLSVVAPFGEAPNSSLAYMLDRVRQRWGGRSSDVFMRGGKLAWRELQVALARAAADQEPVCLLGTALAWLEFLDACATTEWRVLLPPGSRLFETGGYKGRRQRTSRAELLQGFTQTLGIPVTHVVGEYGMTELGSQYYTLDLRASLRCENPPPGALWSYPAWLQPRLLDAGCRDPEAATEVALLSHLDLANRGSAVHVLSTDLGQPCGPSFVLQGRCPRADIRGCGLRFESMSAESEPRGGQSVA